MERTARRATTSESDGQRASRANDSARQRPKLREAPEITTAVDMLAIRHKIRPFLPGVYRLGRTLCRIDDALQVKAMTIARMAMTTIMVVKN